MKKQNTSEELKTAKAELVFQNKEKKKRAAELAIANKELGFQNKEKKNRAAELVIANKELVFQNKEKEKRAAELSIANKELLFQNGQKEKRAQELEIALGELVANEKRYNALIENSADAILILSETGKPSYVSSSIEKILGYTGKEVMQMDILSIAHPDDLEPLAAVIQQVLANPGVPLKGHTGRMRHKNGSWRWLEATVTNMLHDPAIKGIVDNLRDVTENKFAEEKINHLNRLYAFISQINQAIVHSAHEQELFNAACKIAVNVGKFKLAFIGIVNEENGKINLVAEDGAISTDLEVFSSVAYNKNGPVAKLLQSGTLHAINNIAASYLDDRWKQYALTRGFQANIYLAIKKSGKTTAIFTLISAEADFFNQEEIALLAQAADDISFALSVFEKEKLKVNAEEALRESESNLQAIFENSSEGFILTDLAGNIKTFNKKAKEIFLANSGKEIIKGTSIFNFVRESTKEIYKAAIPKVLAGEYLQYDLSFERENGEINWFNFVINRVYNEETVEGFSIKASDITGNKEAEITLRQSELRYRQIVETAQEGIWTIDAADKTTFVNQKMCDIIGYTSAEMMGKTKLFFKDEEGLKIAKDILQKRSKTITETYESSFLTKDGRRIWTQISTNPIINDAGIYQGSLFMVADITDKKRLEKAIENERDQFFEIFSKAPSAIGMLKGADHVYEMVNPVNLQLIGKKDVIGKRAAEVLPEFIEQGIIDMLDRVYTTGKTHIDTEVLIKIDKEGKGELTDVYLNSVYQAYRNNEGKIEGILFFSNDVTEQILSRKAIEKSEKFFKGVIENSADMITMIDAAGNTMYASPAVAKKFGYSSEECLQINLADIVHTDDALTIQQFLGEAMMHPGVPMECPLIQNRKKDGTYFWVEGTLTNFLETEGINAIVANFRDITERKKADEQDRFKVSLLNTIGQAAIATDLDGVINYWNLAAENIYGWTMEEAIGKNIVQLTPSDKTKEQALKIMEDLKHGRTWKGEFRLQRKDGTEFPALVTDSPIYDEHNELSGIISISSDITEKKKLEELLDTTNRLAAIGSWEIDVVKGTVYWSDITKEIREVDNDFVPHLGLGISYFKEDSHKEIISRKVKECIEHGTPWDEELEIVTFKGNYKWVRTIGKGEFINGKCIRVYGSFQDISARKKAEIEVLKVYEDRNIILESIGDGFYALDINWEITYWNKEAEILLGKKREDVIGKNIWDIYPEMVHSNTYIKYHKAMAEKTIQHYERFNETLQSWAEISAYPSSNGLSVYFRDITERKMAEQQIRAEKNMLRTLIDNLPDAIYFKDASARKLISNKFDFNLAGKETEEAVLGKTDLELLPRKAGAICYEQDMEILRTGTPLVNFEEYIIQKNSNPRWLLTTKLPLLNEQNKIVGLLGIGRDITEKKMADEKLNMLNTALEKNIKKLEISNIELEQFAYVASHDLQEPLRMVTSFLTQIEKKYGNILDEKGRKYIHFAVDGAKRMRKIILDLLEYSRVGQTEDKQEEVDLNELLDEILSLLSKKIEEKKAVITVGKLPLLKTLRSPLWQVFQNLVNNSLKYINKDRLPEISIDAKDKKTYWEFAVTDNGIGIDPQYFDKIFTIFQRLHNKEEYTGTGIGLAITKKIIESMGGKIWVESEEGKGSSFYFTIKK